MPAANRTRRIPVGLNIWSRLVGTPSRTSTRPARRSIRSGSPTMCSTSAQGRRGLDACSTFALARYPDKLCGHEVLCNSFRNPAQLAKMAATAQALSGGRVMLGIGAGLERGGVPGLWLAIPDATRRIAQLAEAIELIRRCGREGAGDYQGEHYPDHRCLLRAAADPIPPVMVGGSGEKYLLRVVAQPRRLVELRLPTALGAYTHKQEVLKAPLPRAGPRLRHRS